MCVLSLGRSDPISSNVSLCNKPYLSETPIDSEALPVVHSVQQLSSCTIDPEALVAIISHSARLILGCVLGVTKNVPRHDSACAWECHCFQISMAPLILMMRDKDMILT